MSVHGPKLPFNDFKHIPTRPEIDLLLGVVPSMELKRFEEQLELLEPRIDWSMHWYDNDQGWGYRASYRARVVCILHFHKGHFLASVPLPSDGVDRYLAIRRLPPEFRTAIRKGRPSPRVVWATFRVWKKDHVDGLVAVMHARLRPQDTDGVPLRRPAPHLSAPRSGAADEPTRTPADTVP